MAFFLIMEIESATFHFLRCKNERMILERLSASGANEVTKNSRKAFQTEGSGKVRKTFTLQNLAAGRSRVL